MGIISAGVTAESKIDALQKLYLALVMCDISILYRHRGIFTLMVPY